MRSVGSEEVLSGGTLGMTGGHRTRQHLGLKECLGLCFVHHQLDKGETLPLYWKRERQRRRETENHRPLQADSSGGMPAPSPAICDAGPVPRLSKPRSSSVKW